MKKGLITGVCTTVLMVLSVACKTYQLGVTAEPRENVNTIGVLLAGDVVNYVESSLIYFPNMYPEEQDNNEGLGLNLTFKLPLQFEMGIVQIFPMIAVEGRYYVDLNNEDMFDISSDHFGIGVNFGGGIDLSLNRNIFLRGKSLYQPRLASFFEHSYRGFRFSLALGYRSRNN